MLILIDANSGVPAYRQIVDQVRFQIASGRLPPDAELPSTRVLAQQLGINPMTVSKAYGLLEAEGLVRHRPGLPLTVAEQTTTQVEVAREAQLRVALEAGARAARQLGFSNTRAVAVFRAMLADLTTREDVGDE
ncbi:MAG: GntR family transcriptional regulator [Gemmatimonadaceae bacterium]|nr:GntR family transcriptional regulator [Gemmatimonadaceae bacterium]